jgi:phage baseplate assembly protein gpV
MNRPQALYPPHQPSKKSGDLFGIYLARVLDVNAKTGTVRVMVEEGSRTIDAAVLAPRANNGRGWVWLPEPEDLVAVAFLAGAKPRPIVLGCFYDTRDTLPNVEPGSATLFHQSGTKLQIDANGNLHLTHKSGSDLTKDANNHTVTHHGTTTQIQSNGDIVVTHANGQQIKVTGTEIDLVTGNVSAKVKTTGITLDSNSAGSGAKVVIDTSGAVTITPGGSGIINLGGPGVTNPAIQGGDITGPAIGAGVPAHYHQIIGASTTVFLK